MTRRQQAPSEKPAAALTSRGPELLAAIQASLEADLAAMRERVDAGPFRLYLSKQTNLIWSNYALPQVNSIGPRDVSEMIAAFRSRQRTPRLEFFRELWPSVPMALERAGFKQEREIPAMVCVPESFRPRENPEVSCEALGPDDDPKPYLEVGFEAFGMPGDRLDEGTIESTRANLKTGAYSCAVARIGGRIAGVGCLVGTGSTRELAGIGTLAAFRRRGIASTVSSFLMRTHLREGSLCWLSAGDDVARAVYEGLGFEVVGSQVNYSLEK